MQRPFQAEEGMLLPGPRHHQSHRDAFWWPATPSALGADISGGGGGGGEQSAAGGCVKQMSHCSCGLSAPFRGLGGGRGQLWMIPSTPSPMSYFGERIRRLRMRGLAGN